MKRILLKSATIVHENGVNTYVAFTAEGLKQQLLDYVRDWWEDVAQDGDDDPNTWSFPENEILEYFSRIKGESLFYADTDLLMFPGWEEYAVFIGSNDYEN